MSISEEATPEGESTGLDGASSVERFYERPILNSPYEYPARHWQLDAAGQPTQRVLAYRRPASFVSPIPNPKQQKTPKGPTVEQVGMVLDEGKGLSTEDQQYLATIINRVRERVDEWRRIPDEADWRVTPETARLLRHWRSHRFSGIRPFFCQIEAVETAIWLTEVAPLRKAGRELLEHMADASEEANPGLSRLALKMATGTGKTTVMAMLIAWQTINAVRRPQSRKFTRGFLVVTPGITIRDRLRVLQPNDPDSYYEDRELVPGDMLPDLTHAKIVITNYHAFKLRERMKLSKGSRALLQGRGPAPETTESTGQMIRRVMPELMAMKRIMVLNDEAHHCYREKPGSRDERMLKGDDRKEAKENTEAARLWVSGLEAVERKIGISRVMDLSATPFFLRGSGYAEGTLFPWTMSDFSLMDAIECGIVKLPRVPVADNVPGYDMPRFRNLWEHVGRKMPKKGRGKAGALDPLSLPLDLKSALDALYGHYERTFEAWEKAGIRVPPCFIIVCNNTSTSKLVYDYISGFERAHLDGTSAIENGRLPLFRNFDENGQRIPRPRTLLIDSRQLESGDALDLKFRRMAADEIERFRRERIARTGDRHAGENITDQDLLREVMNTVGKRRRLGGSIRCVVSVSMLTEGWDANTVTHVLGLRAFGTQLLCEQAVGRALRRQSYDLNEEGLFDVEYADVLGIPFDFTAKPVVVRPKPPKETITVRAVRPERDEREIRFPRVIGYRVELPEERLTASFTEASNLKLTPELVGPSITKNEGIVGEGVDLTLEHLEGRRATVTYYLTKHLLYTKWRDEGESPKLYLFGQLKQIARRWLDTCLRCTGDTHHGQLLYRELADLACERITTAILESNGTAQVKALLDPYNPEGSTAHVRFETTKTQRYRTDARFCHVNWAILDSSWEGEFCRVVEAHPQVLAYVKNHNLGLEVPYRHGSEKRTYIPDFVVLVNDGRGRDDPLHLIVEIKGYRREDAKDKKATMENYWVPGINRHGGYGRWSFAEFRDVFELGSDLATAIPEKLDDVMRTATEGRQVSAEEALIRAGGSDPEAEFIPRRRPWA
ncbi:MAG: DEAD/DEAH box helicase family protein [Gemmatimonadetes bacterium]|nr:DEAD/DEAH box helicase family protein [Candidatus Palauibacter rhopaloidicola]